MKIALASFAAVTLGAPAFAADFAGPRVEANVGWDHPQAQVDLN